MTAKLEAQKSRNRWQRARLALLHNPTGVIGLLGMIGLLLVMVFAPIIAPLDPLEMNYEQLKAAPSSAHPFGTDDLGRDMFSRIIWGARESLPIGLIAVAIALSGGTLFGVLSGYYGGLIDNIIMRLVDVFLAFPAILFVLSIVAAVGPGLIVILIALGITAIPGMTRIVRSTVLVAKQSDYVLAARALGASNWRIMWVHILPNIISPIIIYGMLGLGSAILATAGLSYIGLGAQPPSPEWGAMLNQGRRYIRDAWWMSVFPGLAIFISVLFINLLGDALRDALDPRLQ